MKQSTSSVFYQPCLLADNSLVPSQEPNPAPCNLIDFIAVAQKLKISFLEITWQPNRGGIGEGGSGSITQAFMTLHTRLAFKCVSETQKSMSPEDKIFRALIGEIIAFTHPSLRRNRGVINLEGICWDMGNGKEEKEKIWPTLIFEKSPYGDLNTFLTRPEGKELNVKDRVCLCMDIAWALSDMHMHDIFHGDIKPMNVLIFRNDKRYTAKITDFGLSTRDTRENHPVFVAGTPLWTAPELNGHYFTVSQAKKMDIFSYGLLLFWTLFEKYFSGEVPLPEESRQTVQHFGGEQQQNLSMGVISKLKSGMELRLLAKRLLRHGQTFSDDEVEAFDRFFDKALSCNPDDRTDALEILCPFKAQYPLDKAKLDEHDFLPSQCKFELTSSATDFYTLDFRIRRCIRQLLEQRQRASPDDHTAFQLAICNYIGFGGPREEESLNTALQCSKKTQEELQEIVASMRPYERIEERYTGKLYNALEKSGQIDTSPAVHTLREAENAIRQELRDLEHALGKSSKMWLINAGKLAGICEYLGRWRDAEELRKDLLLIYRTLLPEENRTTLRARQDLAATYEHLGRHQEAQELQRQVVDSKIKSPGKNHAETLQSMSHLAFMYRSTRDWEQAKKLELYIMEERIKTLGEEHADTLHTMNSLALIYHEQDLWEKSRELWLRVVEMSRRALGDEDPRTLVHTHDLAVAYRDRGCLQEAKELQEQIVKTSNEVFGERSHRTLGSMAELARTLWRQGARCEAENLLRKVLALTGDSMKEERFTWTVMIDLGGMLNLRDNCAEAVSLHQEVLSSRTKVLGRKHPDTIESMRNLARTFEKQEMFAEAELMFREIAALIGDTRTASATEEQT